MNIIDLIESFALLFGITYVIVFVIWMTAIGIKSYINDRYKIR